MHKISLTHTAVAYWDDGTAGVLVSGKGHAVEVAQKEVLQRYGYSSLLQLQNISTVTARFIASEIDRLAGIYSEGVTS